MMNKKSFQIAGIVLLGALVASLFYLVFNVHAEIKKEAVESQKNFARLVGETADSADFFGFMSDNFVAHQQQLQSRTGSLKMMLITDSRGIAYASPVSSTIQGFDAAGKPVIQTTSPFDTVLSSSVKVRQTGQITVTAVYSLLRSSIAFFYLRNTFLMILAITVLTLMLILASQSYKTTPAVKTKRVTDDDIFDTDTSSLYSTQSDTKEYEPDDVQTYEFEDEKHDSATPQEQPVPAEDSTEFNFDEPGEPNEFDIGGTSEFDFPHQIQEQPSAAPYTQKSAAVYQDEVALKTEDLPISAEPETAEPVDIEPEHNSTPDVQEIEPVQEKQDTAGLFSKATGVCWELYLMDRLNTELSRAVETEQDMALFVIRIEHLERLDMVSRKIASHLITQFKFRDLIFELGKDGYAVILPDVTFGAAMKEAEKMYTEILSILTTEGYKKRVTVGLTVRAGRILPGERFLQEAGNACAKAMTEQDMPVVAFRADPDKYRSFIAGNETNRG